MAEGWAKFKKVCKEVGAWELPQLLQSVKTHTTPTPTPTPSPTPVKQEMKGGEGAGANGCGGSQEQSYQEANYRETNTHQSGGKTVEYRCGNCDIAQTRSNAGMDAHIRSVHTKKALLCSFCTFSTYNFDSLNRHMKEHN